MKTKLKINKSQGIRSSVHLIWGFCQNMFCELKQYYWYNFVKIKLKKKEKKKEKVLLEHLQIVITKLWKIGSTWP